MALTSEEKSVLYILGNAFNQFLALDVMHENDRQEFANAIHVCQNIVLARSGMRDYDEHIRASWRPNEQQTGS